MSSTRRTRNNNMEKGVLGLNDDDIQEELLNADLKALGIGEEELNHMEVQEKQQLLMAFKRSANPQQLQESMSHQIKQASYTNSDDPISCGSSPNARSISDKNEIDITIDSPEEYPSLPSPSTNRRRINPQQRQPLRPTQQLHRQQKQLQQQQPKKQLDQPVDVVTVNSNQEESDDEDVVEEDEEDDDDDDDDDEEEEEDIVEEDDDQMFHFPNFIDDSGCSLKQHARKKPIFRNVNYYTVRPESQRDAVRKMLKHYNSWYKTWFSLEKHSVMPQHSNIFVADVIKINSKQDEIPSTSALSETNDSYSSKVTNESQNNEKPTTFVKSPSPEIEEIEVTEIKTDTSRLTPNAKAKTLPRETRGQNVQTPSSSSSPTIGFNFDKKWDSASGTWTNPRQKRRLLNNQHIPLKEPPNQPKEPPQVEAKVQCPICQLDFSQSKVENHAAVCEGFPTETRSNSATFSSKLEDSNSKDGFSNTAIVELTNSESKIANKKRGN